MTLFKQLTLFCRCLDVCDDCNLPDTYERGLQIQRPPWSPLSLTNTHHSRGCSPVPWQHDELYDPDIEKCRLLVLHWNIYHSYLSLYCVVLNLLKSAQNREVLRHLWAVSRQEWKIIIAKFRVKANTSHRAWYEAGGRGGSDALRVWNSERNSLS